MPLESGNIVKTKRGNLRGQILTLVLLLFCIFHRMFFLLMFCFYSKGYYFCLSPYTCALQILIKNPFPRMEEKSWVCIFNEMLIFMKYLNFFILVYFFFFYIILGQQVLKGRLFCIFSESLMLFDVNSFWQPKDLGLRICLCGTKAKVRHVLSEKLSPLRTSGFLQFRRNCRGLGSYSVLTLANIHPTQCQN